MRFFFFFYPAKYDFLKVFCVILLFELWSPACAVIELYFLLVNKITPCSGNDN